LRAPSVRGVPKARILIRFAASQTTLPFGDSLRVAMREETIGPFFRLRMKAGALNGWRQEGELGIA
jgi:hypothetical protein